MKEKEIIPLKKITKGAGIFFVGMLVAKVLTYIYQIILARMGTEIYGLFAIGFAIVGIASILATLGLDSGLIRYVSFFKGRKDKARIKGVITTSMKITFPLSLVFGFIMFIAAGEISVSVFHNPGLIPVLQVFSLAVPFYTLRNIFLAATRAMQKVKYEVYTRWILEDVFKIALTILAIYMGYSFFGAVVAYPLAMILTFLLAFYYLEKKTFPVLKTRVKSVRITGELLSYSWPLLISSIMSMIIVWTDILMIGHFLPTSSAGIYNAALVTSTLMLIMIRAIVYLFMPVVSELYGKKEEITPQIRKVYATTTRWVFAFNLPLFAILFIFSSQILNVLFSADYVSAALSLSILVSGYMVFSTLNVSEYVLGVIKRTRSILAVTIIAAAVNIALNYFLIPVYGIVGGAIATAVSLALYGILEFSWMYICTRMHPVNRNYVQPLVLCALLVPLIFYAANVLFFRVGLLELAFLLAAFVASYTGLLYLLRGFTKEDISILRAIKRKVF
jgi:O-antigen/teichoic acid export membrane protein